MYIGKNRGPFDNGDKGETPIHIPENYAGNAFSPRNIEEPVIETSECNTACTTEHIPNPLPDTRKKGGCFKAENLFSTDILLVLLAILLFGNEENGELPIILLLLLLF